MARKALTQGSIEFDWVQPDATLVQHRLLNLADELEDMMLPMAAASTVAQQNMATRFKTGTDPNDVPWDAWAESYAPYALRHSTGPILPDRANLHLTGDLERAATSPSAFIATPTGLFFDTGDLPEYWAANNFGATRATRSEGSSEADIQKTARHIVIENFKRGKKVSASEALQRARTTASAGQNELPPRPFIGLSKVAQAKVIAIFNNWFTGTVETFVSPIGRTFARKRIPKGQPGAGRFAPIR
jgi:phage gpG-like protein